MNPDTRPLAQFAHAPLLLLVIAYLMMQPLSTDLYLASLPSLATTFNVPTSTVQLTLSVFVIGFGFAQLIVGPLSDRYGRRPVLLWGLAIYALGSALCTFAPSIQLLIAARVLQAIGCCCAIMNSRAIVRDAYDPEHSVKVITRASTWLALAPLLGPILGSYLQVTFGWRAAFVVHTLLSTTLLVLTFLRLPETNLHKNPDATNLAGLSANFRLVLGAREFWAYALPGALSYGALFAFISGASTVLIRVLQVPTEYFGYCFAFGVSGYLCGTLVCRRLLARIGTPATFRVGSTMSLAAGALFLAAVLAGLAHWSIVVIAMSLTMGAHGINYPVSQAGAVNPFPRQAGTAAGLAGALSMLVAFIVGTIVGASYNGTLTPLAVLAGALGLSIFVAARMFVPMQTAT
ncbi:multidrug effflux MFS transporter [Lacisediminimonas sp.]|uniref:multidrug effflux MFS transporter n=1 Tax=Lacisediminimonas sp. TaxID=3060582 RepID=UPI0027223626|nr:multidrug effflux MFS transporter [Lacisediminimonas sp.]MDO8299326.1 multidrug effflux MFS transporter [Lacisediminimonas sp.]